MTKKRHESLGLTDNDVLNMYEKMLLARKIDERMWLLNRSGKIPFVVSGQGQEAAQVGAAFALDQTRDYLAPYYRDLAMVVSFGMSAEDMMMAAFAKEADPSSAGRQMPNHFGSKKHRIISGSSPVTTQLPHAVGFALAAKLKGENFVTLTALGDGSTNQGDFHEGLNFAGVHKLPVITLVQNNGLAISVPFEKQVASENIAVRGASYGMPGIVVDGTDALAVYEAVQEASERAVKGEGPTLIEAVTVRLQAHSSDDNDRTYRTEEELAEAKEKDGIMRFRDYLKEVNVLTDEIEAEIEEKITKELNDATKAAEKAPFAEVETLEQYVYEEQ
ncbi:MAG TPA: thiamine pyrophosphate-dependent dehydrogenase E1 component subunit alpha [Pseudogracilibacillus sp.]|nr:thiamine pyrophosphate-dependent dehydrogenase E1 component subunit alpha [Pseudogracilibacillus sp.]